MTVDNEPKATKLLIPSRPLMLIPALAVRIGLDEAVVLQQFHYWLSDSTHFHEGQRWIYNTMSEWQAQFSFWPERKIRRIIKSLRLQGLIRVEQFHKSRCDRTNWYAINYNEVERLAPEVEQIAARSKEAQTAKATKRRAQRGQFVRLNEHNSSSSLT